ncbi:MAG TPA: Mrp/NBP35 family ATP-binding protein [Candidatus Binatia bacterium]|nr:Mrp/NBP35 family ATP-binding protein [Candidatus Binatia bacterium]
MASPQEILERLKAVPYPGYSRNIVSFGLVKDIQVSSDAVTVELAPSTAQADVLARIEADVRAAIASIGGLPPRIEIVRTPVAARPAVARGPQPIPDVANVVAVASGKGGVGKSTVATNLALALAQLVPHVGLMDADVYGPSVPIMLGVEEKGRPGEGRRLVPAEKHGIRVISMGMFLDESTPVIWRGPMVSKLVTEFLRNVEWGELDVLVVDLPPGTGDVQLTLTQQVPITGGVIVTTPQDLALADVRRGIAMFRQVKAPILGIVENMSVHVCPGCGDEVHLFGEAGGAAMARAEGIPLLGAVPIVRAIREAGDRGVPIVAADPSHPQSRAFREIAERVLVRLTEARRTQAAAPLPVVS